MPVPEPLVAVRSYDSPQLAAADAELLTSAGLNPYVAGGYFQQRLRSQLCVPESQALASLDLLPPELPTLSDDLSRATAPCGRCGAEGVHVTSPATGYVLIGGAALAVWALINGQASAATGAMVAAIALAVPLRVLTRHYLCERCGNTWRRGGPDIRQFPKSAQRRNKI